MNELPKVGDIICVREALFRRLSAVGIRIQCLVVVTQAPHVNSIDYPAFVRVKNLDGSSIANDNGDKFYADGTYAVAWRDCDATT